MSASLQNGGFPAVSSTGALPANSGNRSVFDTFTNSIRQNVVRGASSLVNSWSECAYVIKYTRYTAYVITVLLLFVVIGVIMKWSNALVMVLSIFAILCSAFQAYLVSQESCSRVFRDVA